MAYTLGEAAIAVGKSKATISKAIKNGTISAERRENGSFAIQASELFRVYPKRPTEHESEQEQTPPLNSNELIELRVRLEAALERVKDLEDDRDQWRQQANRLLSYQGDKEAVGFWQRLFGK
jgi:hypothetical protein